MFELRKAEDRGLSDYGWLYSKHTFSFANYYDPNQIGFSDLLVINDDRVAAGQGFGSHPHKDMEIFSYVLAGALEHRDSMANGSIIYPGDVQMMSAGTGVQHSEMNPRLDSDLHFLQIWITPNHRGAEPRYQQVHFSDEDKRGRLCLIISPNGENGSLSVHQDIHVYTGLFDGDEQASLHLASNRYAYIHVATGEISVNGLTLKAGDGAKVRNEKVLSFSAGNNAEVLIFDMRPNELPVS